MASAAEDRRKNAYGQATSLSQAELDECFRGGENQIEAVGILTKTVGATTYTLRFADRPKYVGDNFYEGRAQFPKVKRTMPALQSPALQFSQMEVQLANMDGFYNNYLEGGADYISWIGARLVIQVGLRDISGSFVTVFDGIVPTEDGFQVERENVIIRATDKFNNLNVKPGLPYISSTEFPSAPAESLGKSIPMVLGDWEAGYSYTAKAGQVDVTNGAVTPINGSVYLDAPADFAGGCIGYYVGGGYFVFSIGTYTPDTIAKVHIKRGEQMLQCNFNATPQASTSGYWMAQVTSLAAVPSGTWTYVYQTGDIAMISVKVPYATGKYSNVIEIAQQIIYLLAGLSSSDINTTTWNALIAKSTPAQSDFTSIKGRLWIGDEKDTILSIFLSYLEQVRVEGYINLDGLIDLRTLHPEDFPAPASATRTDQSEVAEDTVKGTADDRTFFNEAIIDYAFTPVTGKTARSTPRYRNQNSIDKSGKTVSKAIDAPFLYQDADAQNQLTEFLRFYSTGLVFVDVEVAWVHLLRDLGDFLAFNYNIGSIAYTSAPMMVREKSINLATGAVLFKLLSFANFGYSGYSPSNASRFLSSAAQSIVAS